MPRASRFVQPADHVQLHVCAIPVDASQPHAVARAVDDPASGGAERELIGGQQLGVHGSGVRHQQRPHAGRLGAGVDAAVRAVRCALSLHTYQ
eukprot:4863099-Prymnesium_polylepis.1